MFRICVTIFIDGGSSSGEGHIILLAMMIGEYRPNWN